ncbi:MAG TPA: sugar transferase [Terracidiphilus sp.]|nr:sugar transferase [Terracidiphilus sp.]
MQMRQWGIDVEGKNQRQMAPGGGGVVGGKYVRTQLFTRSVPEDIRVQVYRTSHREIHEPPRTKKIRLEDEISPWGCSNAKRAMDVALVLVFSPILLAILAAIAFAVLLTSGTPILFRQQRVGRNAAPFVIYKFRTMRPARAQPPSARAIDSADRVTWIGRFLRQSKLDELPQVFNVLTGEMSLVGPRPKVPEQDRETLPCRPGLTGAATLVFAREEMMLRRIPTADLDEFFQNTILSAKREIDVDYMRRSTVWSDLRILANTILGRWESYSRESSWRHVRERRLKASG